MKDWDHPGGVQTFGNYLFVPNEKGKESCISVYDIHQIEKATQKDIEPLIVYYFNHRAGCCGITDFVHNGNKFCLLMVGDDETYYAYIASMFGVTDITDLKFSLIGSITLKGLPLEKGSDINCQGFGLITETTNDGDQLYMVALTSRGTSNTYEDWAYLIALNIDFTTMGIPTIIELKSQKIICRHLISKGGVHGVAGTHFRWGCGIRVTPSGHLVIMATSRNILVGTFLNTCYWSTSKTE